LPISNRLFGARCARRHFDAPAKIGALRRKLLPCLEPLPN
jgi:hypothetical protein